MQESKKKLTAAGKYEAPELRTYGKLSDLTRGGGSPLDDNGLFKN